VLGIGSLLAVEGFLSPAEMPGATGEAVPVLGKDKKMALSANARIPNVGRFPGLNNRCE